MTHGDKAKAKTGKSSQASGSKKSSSKAGAAAKSGKAAREGKAAGKGSTPKAPEKISVKKGGAAKSAAAAPPPKKAGSAPARETVSEARTAKTRGGSDDSAGFSNPVIAAAFRRAVKKYPNAFRKLTD